MAKIQVTQYAAEWNPRANKGVVQTLFANGSRSQVPIESAEEMLIVLTLLGKAPTFLDGNTKDIEVPWRPVGT
jgi:hypothetical protein